MGTFTRLEDQLFEDSEQSDEEEDECDTRQSHCNQAEGYEHDDPSRAIDGQRPNSGGDRLQGVGDTGREIFHDRRLASHGKTVTAAVYQEPGIPPVAYFSNLLVMFWE